MNSHSVTVTVLVNHKKFISRLSMIVRVNIVLNRTVVVDSDWHFDNLCGSHLQSQSELYHVSWWCWTLVIDLIGQLSCDVTGCPSVKPFNPGFKPFTVSQNISNINFELNWIELKYMQWIIFWTVDRDMKLNMFFAVENTFSTPYWLFIQLQRSCSLSYRNFEMQKGGDT